MVNTMGKKFRVKACEVDGVELDFETEIELDLENISSKNLGKKDLQSAITDCLNSRFSAYEVAEEESIEIPLRRQMLVKGRMRIDGKISIKGKLTFI